MMARCVQEEERLKAGRIEHINQVQRSEKKRFKKFVSSYMKPKPNQFKDKGQSSKGAQQKKPNEPRDPNACRHCGNLGHIRRDCYKFKRWLQDKGIPYEEDPKKRGKNH